MLKDIILGALTTALGAIALTFFNDLAKTQPLLAAAGVVATVLIVVLLVGFKRNLLLMLKPAGRDLHVEGLWETTWSYQNENGRVTVNDRLVLHQIGSFVWGAGNSTTVEGPTNHKFFNYILRGGINADRILSGSWRNVDPGRSFYGHVQVLLRRGGTAAEGNWIGTADNCPRAGEWRWRKT